MKKIRVVITDDSSLARSLLRELLAGESDIEVIGEAENGQQAVVMARALKPDLMTMDLEMPVMNGMDAIKEIMLTKAVPILVVSSVADAKNALEAVGHGALEVMSKPEFTPAHAAQFVAKVRMLAGVSVITRMRPRPQLPGAAVPLTGPQAVLPVPRFGTDSGASSWSRIIAIASSTGGPQALAHILPALPAGFPAPVLIAQHISDGFAGGMADWLGTLCVLPVRLAAQDELLQAGVIYISPSERHLSVTSARRLSLVERGALDVYRPSCDVLLGAVADVFGRQAIGLILTGMGSDGAKGLLRIREKGGMTLAQDEASSVIYGMNRVAIEAGGAHQILPLAAIAATLCQLADPYPFNPGAGRGTCA